ncbi:MAG: hypothetical protein K9J13_09530 [Saprospiraceae bacterium]|nr:hypothetical protein [Saprospiraceae bacterium]
MTIRYFFLTIIILLSGFNSQAQNYSSDMKKLAATYMNSTQYCMDINIRAYDAKNQQDYNEFKAQAIRNDESFYSTSFDVYTIIQPLYVLQVDKKQKNIVFVNNKENKNLYNNSLTDVGSILDSLTKENKGVKFIRNQNDCNTYELTSSTYSDYKKVQITINTKKNILEEIVFFYKKGQTYSKVQVTYKMRKASQSELELTSGKKYVNVKQGKPNLTQAYKEYRLIIADN